MFEPKLLPPFGKSPYWQIRYPDGRGGRPCQSTKTRTEKEARAFFSIWLAKEWPRLKDAIDNPKPVAATITMGDVWKIYDEAKPARSRKNRDAAWRVFAPVFKDVEIAKLSKTHFNEWLKLRRANALPGITGTAARPTDRTIKTHLLLFWAALNYVRAQTDLLDGVSLPVWKFTVEEARKPIVFLEADEREQLLAAMQREHDQGNGYIRPLFAFIYIAMFSGQRVQAVLDLTWDRIDFERNEIDFRMPGAVESKKRRAKQSINRNVFLPILQRLNAQRSDDNPNARVCQISLSALVVTLKNFARRAGIRKNLASTKIFRKTCISMLSDAGLSAKQISVHTAQTPAVIEQFYQGIGKEAREETVVMLDNLFMGKKAA